MVGTTNSMTIGTDLRRGLVERTIQRISDRVRGLAAGTRTEDLDRVAWTRETPREIAQLNRVSREASLSPLRWGRLV